MGVNDSAEQLEAAKAEVVRLEHLIAEMRGLPMPDAGEELPLPVGASLVTDFAAHAVTVTTAVPTEPAVPAVQLAVNVVPIDDTTGPRTRATLLLEEKAARDVAHALINAGNLLANLRHNQEGPDHG